MHRSHIRKGGVGLTILTGQGFSIFHQICVHYKSRFNSSLNRNDVLSEVSSLFLNFGHKVDLKNPDMVIVVEIMRVRKHTCSLTYFYGLIFCV